jgi:hypothetical protein
LALVIAQALGCGSTAVPADEVSQTQLEDVYGMYKTHVEKLKRPPTKLSQLEPWEPAYVNGYAAVNQGEVMVKWGQALSPGGGANTGVLAYEKDTPSKGGFVLLQDGTVKHVSAAEFEAFPKTGAK